MKLSIILPVYNVEQYIEKCLLSVIPQLSEEDELIIIDDGSTDKSGQICDKYSDHYENVFVCHVKNGGVSNARNIGLQKASGQYVWFIDSDDYIQKEAVDTIKRNLAQESCDLLLFDAEAVDTDGVRIEKIGIEDVAHFEMQKDIISKMLFHNTALWNRIYCMEVIKKAELQFDAGITIAEDLLFNFKYLLECTKINYIAESLYFYVIRENSAMAGAGKNADVSVALDALYAFYKEKNAYETYKDALDYLAVKHYYIVTSVRVIRYDKTYKGCKKINQWFQEKGITPSLHNPFVKQMPLKHKLILVLMKMKMYGVIKFIFEKK